MQLLRCRWILLCMVGLIAIITLCFEMFQMSVTSNMMRSTTVPATAPSPTYHKLVRFIHRNYNRSSEEERIARGKIAKLNSYTKIHFHINQGCASETVSSVLAYHGINHKRKFGITRDLKKSHLPQRFSNTSLVKDGRGIELLVTESFIDSPEIDLAFGAGVLHVTTICRPFQIFESLYHRLNLEKCFGVDLSDFLLHENHLGMTNEDLARCPEAEGVDVNYLRMPMLYGFGADPRQADNFSHINSVSDRVLNRFGLVIMGDQINNGLIILRDMLGMNTEEIVTLDKNKRFRDQKSTLERNQKITLENWAWPDKMLYEKLKIRNLAKWKDFKLYINKETIKLRSYRRTLEKICVNNTVSAESVNLPQLRSERSDIRGYNLKLNQEGQSLECMLRTAPLDSLRYFIRRRKWPS